MLRKNSLISLFCFLSLVAWKEISCQVKTIDSLHNLVRADKEDTLKVLHCSALYNEYRGTGELDKAMEFARLQLQLAQKIKWKKGIGSGFMNVGVVYDYRNDFNQALTNYQEALSVKEELLAALKTSGDKQALRKAKKDLAKTLSNIATTYRNLGDYTRAISNALKALALREEIVEELKVSGESTSELIKCKQDLAHSYNNIGNIFYIQHNYGLALKNYNEGLAIRKEISANGFSGAIDLADSYNNIGTVLLYMGKHDQSLSSLTQSMAIKEKLLTTIKNGEKTEQVRKLKHGIASSCTNIGNIYYEKGKALNEPGTSAAKLFAEALNYYMKSLKLSEELAEHEGLARSYTNVGNIYSYQHKFKESEQMHLKALEMDRKSGNRNGIKSDYSSLAQLCAEQKNFESAYEYYKLHSQLKDSLFNEESATQIAEMQTKFETGKKEQQIVLLNKDKQISLSESKKQKILTAAIFGGLVMVIGFSIFIVKRFRVSQKQKKIIEEQKLKVDAAYEKLHEKNKEVMDSIYYARRIQKALITSEKYINKNLRKLNAGNK